MPLVVVEIPVQFLDRVQELFPRPGFNGIHGQAVLGHGRQLPVQHEILAREVPEPIFDGRQDAPGENIGRDFEKNFVSTYFNTRIRAPYPAGQTPETTRAK